MANFWDNPPEFDDYDLDPYFTDSTPTFQSQRGGPSRKELRLASKFWRRSQVQTREDATLYGMQMGFTREQVQDQMREAWHAGAVDPSESNFPQQAAEYLYQENLWGYEPYLDKWAASKGKHELAPINPAQWRNFPSQRRERLVKGLVVDQLPKDAWGNPEIPSGFVRRKQEAWAAPIDVLTHGSWMGREGDTTYSTFAEDKLLKRYQMLGAHETVGLTGASNTRGFMRPGSSSQISDPFTNLTGAYILGGEIDAPGQGYIDPSVGRARSARSMDIFPQVGSDFDWMARKGSKFAAGQDIQLAAGLEPYQDRWWDTEVTDVRRFTKHIKGKEVTGYRMTLERTADLSQARLQAKHAGSKLALTPKDLSGVTFADTGTSAGLQFMGGLKDPQGMVYEHFMAQSPEYLARQLGMDVGDLPKDYSSISKSAMAAFEKNIFSDMLREIDVPLTIHGSQLDKFKGQLIDEPRQVSQDTFGQPIYEATGRYQALVGEFGKQITRGYGVKQVFLNPIELERLRTQQPKMYDQVMQSSASQREAYGAMVSTAAGVSIDGEKRMNAAEAQAIYGKAAERARVEAGVDNLDMVSQRSIAKHLTTELDRAGYGRQSFRLQGAGGAEIQSPGGRHLGYFAARGEFEGEEASRMLGSLTQAFANVSSADVFSGTKDQPGMAQQFNEAVLEIGGSKHGLRRAMGAYLPGSQAVGDVLRGSSALAPREVNIPGQKPGLFQGFGFPSQGEAAWSPEAWVYNIGGVEAARRNIDPNAFATSVDLAQMHGRDNDQDLFYAMRRGDIQATAKGTLIDTGTGDPLMRGDTPLNVNDPVAMNAFISEQGETAIAQGAGRLTDDLVGLGSKSTAQQIADIRNVLRSPHEITTPQIQSRVDEMAQLYSDIGPYYNRMQEAFGQARQDPKARTAVEGLWNASHNRAQRPSRLTAGSQHLQDLTTFNFATNAVYQRGSRGPGMVTAGKGLYGLMGEAARGLIESEVGPEAFAALMAPEEHRGAVQELYAKHRGGSTNVAGLTEQLAQTFAGGGLTGEQAWAGKAPMGQFYGGQAVKKFLTPRMDERGNEIPGGTFSQLASKHGVPEQLAHELYGYGVAQEALTATLRKQKRATPEEVMVGIQQAKASGLSLPTTIQSPATGMAAEILEASSASGQRVQAKIAALDNAIVRGGGSSASAATAQTARQTTQVATEEVGPTLSGILERHGGTAAWESSLGQVLSEGYQNVPDRVTRGVLNDVMQQAPELLGEYQAFAAERGVNIPIDASTGVPYHDYAGARQQSSARGTFHSAPGPGAPPPGDPRRRGMPATYEGDDFMSAHGPGSGRGGSGSGGGRRGGPPVALGTPPPPGGGSGGQPPSTGRWTYEFDDEGIFQKAWKQKAAADRVIAADRGLSAYDEMLYAMEEGQSIDERSYYQMARRGDIKARDFRRVQAAQQIFSGGQVTQKGYEAAVDVMWAMGEQYDVIQGAEGDEGLTTQKWRQRLGEVQGVVAGAGQHLEGQRRREIGDNFFKAMQRSEEGLKGFADQMKKTTATLEDVDDFMTKEFRGSRKGNLEAIQEQRARLEHRDRQLGRFLSEYGGDAETLAQHGDPRLRDQVRAAETQRRDIYGRLTTMRDEEFDLQERIGKQQGASFRSMRRIMGLSYVPWQMSMLPMWGGQQQQQWMGAAAGVDASLASASYMAGGPADMGVAGVLQQRQATQGWGQYFMGQGAAESNLGRGAFSQFMLENPNVARGLGTAAPYGQVLGGGIMAEMMMMNTFGKSISPWSANSMFGRFSGAAKIGAGVGMVAGSASLATDIVNSTTGTELDTASFFTQGAPAGFQGARQGMFALAGSAAIGLRDNENQGIFGRIGRGIGGAWAGALGQYAEMSADVEGYARGEDELRLFGSGPVLPRWMSRVASNLGGIGINPAQEELQSQRDATQAQKTTIFAERVEVLAKELAGQGVSPQAFGTYAQGYAQAGITDPQQMATLAGQAFGIEQRLGLTEGTIAGTAAGMATTGGDRGAMTVRLQEWLGGLAPERQLRGLQGFQTSMQAWGEMPERLGLSVEQGQSMSEATAFMRPFERQRYMQNVTLSTPRAWSRQMSAMGFGDLMLQDELGRPSNYEESRAVQLAQRQWDRTRTEFDLGQGREQITMQREWMGRGQAIDDEQVGIRNRRRIEDADLSLASLQLRYDEATGMGSGRSRADINRQMFERSVQWQMEDLDRGDVRARTQFGWQQQDWAENRQQFSTQLGWQMDDIGENIRFATGRQRRRLLEQRERLVVQAGWQQRDMGQAEQRGRIQYEWGVDDRERQRGRLEESTADQRELMEQEEKSRERSLELLRQQLELEKERRDELETKVIPLEEQQRELQREQAEQGLQWKAERQALDEAYYAQMQPLQEELNEATDKMAEAWAAWQTIMEEGLPKAAEIFGRTFGEDSDAFRAMQKWQKMIEDFDQLGQGIETGTSGAISRWAERYMPTYTLR